jgi:glutamate--cysteine ligase
VRYGKVMQCIAGLHYNFSLPDPLWQHPGIFEPTPQVQSDGYVSLIRNFMRHSWLLMYLFGASPALSSNFLRGQPGIDLQTLSPDTHYLPWATSLRMSDLGYQNKAQSTLKLCYNDLPTFLDRLYNAVTTSWDAYEAIGTQRDGQWLQLNCNLLQIENEFYSPIRPKRTTGRGERPITALAQRGVQYVEVRCLDIDPFAPAGITADSVRFMDAFLLFCALEHSPPFGDDGYCAESAQNFNRVVVEGRKPGLTLYRGGVPVELTDWASQVLEQVHACAEVLAEHSKDPLYLGAVTSQQAKVDDPAKTPAARAIATMGDQQQSFQEFGLALARTHTAHFKALGLTEQQRAQAGALAIKSLAQQAELEADDTLTFEQYVKQFDAALEKP